MNLCDICKDPGACCRNIVLTSRVPEVIMLLKQGHKLEVLAYLAHNWYPYIPDRRTDDWWVFECPMLSAEGRCMDYENRPGPCRAFIAGSSELCKIDGIVNEFM